MVYAYITNETDSTVSVIDTATKTVKTGTGYPISVGSDPYGVAVTPNGNKVYVVNNSGGGAGTVSVIDTGAHTVSTTVNVGTDAIGVAVTPDSTKAYVTNFHDNTVSVIDTSHDTVSKTLGGLSGPVGVAVNPNGKYAYAANYSGGSISVIDTSNDTVSTTISGSNLSAPHGLAFTANGSYAYVTDEGSNYVTVIDAVAHSIYTSIYIGHSTDAVATTPSDKYAYVTVDSASLVCVIDTSANTLAKTITTSSYTQGIAVTSDSQYAYTADPINGKVVVINVATNTIDTTLTVGNGPVAFGMFIQPGSSPMTNIYTAPQGRLTLTSGTPVMTTDATGTNAENVYYTPYQGNIVPIYDGTNMNSYATGELTMALDTSNQTSGNIYDLFVFLHSGAVTIGAGPAWSTAPSSGHGGARGSGAGTTELQQIEGLQTNKNTITLYNGSTSYTNIAANEATYVGSVYMVANGQTAMQFAPGAAAGGTNNFLGLYNAYNRVSTISVEQDSTNGWTSTSATIHPANYDYGGTGSNLKNRITFLDGLQQSAFTAQYQTIAYATTTSYSYIGIGLDNTSPSAFSGTAGQIDNLGGRSSSPALFASPPLKGLHYVQALEYAGSSTTFGVGGGGPGMELILEIDM